MDLRFQEYGRAVCSFLRYATAEEKASVRQELANHLEDHAQALIDAGYGEADALDMALEAMGDPEEVGKELHKEYPFRWLLLSRLMMGVLAVLVFCYLLYFPVWWPGGFIEQVQARLDPASHHAYEDPPTDLYPLDIRWELPGGTILRIYGLTLQGSAVDLYTVTYPKNPFSLRWNDVSYLDFSYTLHGVETPHKASRSKGHQMLYCRHSITGLPEGCSLTVYYQRYGTEFQAELPLPWKEGEP